MTLPAAPPISWTQICAEFGLNPATAVWPASFYGKGGAPGSGALSFADFLGRSAAPPVTFNPVAGNYYVDDGGISQTVNFAISASQAVVWTWTRTGTGTCNVVSGNSAVTITFTQTAGLNDRTGTFTVSANGQTWTVTLSTTGGGGGGSVMTL